MNVPITAQLRMLAVFVKGKMAMTAPIPNAATVIQYKEVFERPTLFNGGKKTKMLPKRNPIIAVGNIVDRSGMPHTYLIKAPRKPPKMFIIGIFESSIILRLTNNANCNRQSHVFVVVHKYATVYYCRSDESNDSNSVCSEEELRN